jgi:hypothetical protein
MLVAVSEYLCRNGSFTDQRQLPAQVIRGPFWLWNTVVCLLEHHFGELFTVLR